MQVSRRGLLGMLAVGVGAAIVRPGVLMPVKPALVTGGRVFTPQEFADVYLNRIVRHWVDIQKIRDRNVLLSFAPYAGDPHLKFRGIPIRVVEPLHG